MKKIVSLFLIAAMVLSICISPVLAADYEEYDLAGYDAAKAYFNVGGIGDNSTNMFTVDDNTTGERLPYKIKVNGTAQAVTYESTASKIIRLNSDKTNTTVADGDAVINTPQTGYVTSEDYDYRYETVKATINGYKQETKILIAPKYSETIFATGFDTLEINDTEVNEKTTEQIFIPAEDSTNKADAKFDGWYIDTTEEDMLNRRWFYDTNSSGTRGTGLGDYVSLRMVNTVDATGGSKVSVNNALYFYRSLPANGGTYKKYADGTSVKNDEFMAVTHDIAPISSGKAVLAFRFTPNNSGTRFVIGDIAVLEGGVVKSLDIDTTHTENGAYTDTAGTSTDFMFVIDFDATENNVYVYANSEYKGTFTDELPDNTLSKVSFYALGSGSQKHVTLDNIILQKVYTEAEVAQMELAKYQDALNAYAFPSAITSDLPGTITLSDKENCAVAYSAAPSGIIGANGAFTEPERDTVVTITATVTLEAGKTVTREFTATAKSANPFNNFAFTTDGSKYVTENLPSTVEFGGENYNITYTDTTGIVASNGAVTLPDSYTDITVTAKVNVGGKDYERTLNLVATPSGAVTHINAGFGSAAPSGEQLLTDADAYPESGSNSSVSGDFDGWGYLSSQGKPSVQDGTTFGILDNSSNNVLHVVRTKNTTDITNLMLAHPYTDRPEEITVIKASIYKEVGKSFHIQLRPYIGELFVDTAALQFKSRAESNFTKYESLYGDNTNGWHDYTFVVDVKNMTFDFYFDNEYICTKTTAADTGANGFYITCPRNIQATTDIYMDNILVQTMPSQMYYTIKDITSTTAKVTQYMKDEKAKLFVAAYTGEKEMTDVATATIPADIKFDTSTEVNLSKGITIPDGGYAKAFIFNGTSLAPLAKDIEKKTE